MMKVKIQLISLKISKHRRNFKSKKLLKGRSNLASSADDTNPNTVKIKARSPQDEESESLLV